MNALPVVVTGVDCKTRLKHTEYRNKYIIQDRIPVSQKQSGNYKSAYKIDTCHLFPG